MRGYQVNVESAGISRDNVGAVELPPEKQDTYESRLNTDRRWALLEGSRHFDESSAVFATLHRIAHKLDELRIPYSVVGGMAVFRHGLRRFTEDVDILVTKESLKRIHAALDGKGFVPPFRNSKNLIDTQDKVKIEFLLTGEYPGDGKPKPFAFPDPATVSIEEDGIKYVNLVTLIEMKLASGMTESRRLQDLADVQRLIQILTLPADFSANLNPYVQEKFAELWYQDNKRYVLRFRTNRTTAKSASAGGMAGVIQEVSTKLNEMLEDGIIIETDNDCDSENDYMVLITTDPLLAAKYDMVEESEYWPNSDVLEPDTHF